MDKRTLNEHYSEIAKEIIETDKSRKLVKIHQNVLVFYKGDLKKIKDNFKEIEVGEISEESFNG